MPTWNIHTLILNMCVLPPFGVNNPASLLPFLRDRPYDTKSGYNEILTKLKNSDEDTSLMDDHVCMVVDS